MGDKGLSIGIDTFGESAPAPKLYQHFGLTSEAMSQKIIQHLKGEEV